MRFAQFGLHWPSDSGEEDKNVNSLWIDRQMTGDQNSSFIFQLYGALN